MQQILGPIWDAIDDEQFSDALQLVEKSQTRYRVPNMTLLGLQTLCLAKEGRMQDAIDVSNQMIKVAPKSNETYQIIHDSFRTSPSQLVADYLVDTMEAGFKEIKSEFMGRLWFMEAVRTGRLQAQRRAAVELQKGFLARDYFYLVVMSMYLLYQQSEGKDKQLLGMLMDRMICKAADNVPQSDDKLPDASNTGPRIETVEEFYLYLDILRTMSRDEDALAALKGPHGIRYANNHEFMLLELELLVAIDGVQGQRSRAFTQRCIERQVDDWIVWKAYVDSIDTTDDALRIATSDLLGLSLKSGPSRNQELAKVYWAYRLYSSDLSAKSLVKYFQSFADKLVTFEDLAPYLSSCQPDQQLLFIEGIKSFKTGSDIGQSIAHTNVIKFEGFLATSQSKDAESTRAELIERALVSYRDSLLLGGDLKVTDNQYGDDLLLLAAQMLCEDKHDLVNIRQATVLLEFGLMKSRHNFQFRLQLIELYRQLGAWASAQIHFAALGIKSVQRDTLSHILLQSSVPEYISSLQLSSLKDSQNIYLANQVETPDVICQAWESRTYSKIQEFMKYQERLAKSIWKFESDVQIWELQILLDKFDIYTHCDTTVLDGAVYDSKSTNIVLNLQASAKFHQGHQEEHLVQLSDSNSVRRSMHKLQMLQAIIRNDEAIVEQDVPKTRDQSISCDSDLSCSIVRSIYAVKFDEDPLRSLRDLEALAATLSVPKISSHEFDKPQLIHLGDLVSASKYYAVLLPSLKKSKELSRITKAFASLVSKLKAELDTLRRDIASNSVPIDDRYVTLVGGDAGVCETFEKRIRGAQAQSVTCLIGVLKCIKL